MEMQLQIKVCGMKAPENIREVSQLSPDYMGFVFYRQSPRYCGNLLPETLHFLPQNIIKTGVFVDEEIGEVLRIAEAYRLDAVQLHGSETPAYCDELKRAKALVIKAFGIDETFDFKNLEPYLDKVDMFLFDTSTVSHGGSGRRFDWKQLGKYPYSKAYLLSGGIGPDHVGEIKALNDSRLAGIDINSRFELSPGYKDIKSITDFFKELDR